MSETCKTKIPNHVPCKRCLMLARCQSLALWELMSKCTIFKTFVVEDVPIKIYPWHSCLYDVVNAKDPMSIEGARIIWSLPEKLQRRK